MRVQFPTDTELYLLLGRAIIVTFLSAFALTIVSYTYTYSFISWLAISSLVLEMIIF